MTGPLRWIRDKAWLVESAALGKRRSHHVKDRRLLAAAVAVSAQAVATCGEDSLVLSIPFGVPMLRPTVQTR